MTNEKAPELELPERIAVRICRCGAIETGTNACAYCGAGWAQVKVPLTTFYRTASASAAPVVDEIADLVPSNWLDPLLSGPDKVIGEYPYSCPDIERLLNAIKRRIHDAGSGIVSRKTSNANT